MDESQKELQNIFQGQSAMKEILTDLHRKMDDIISRQERAFNAISAIQVLYFEIMITNPNAIWSRVINQLKNVLNIDSHI